MKKIILVALAGLIGWLLYQSVFKPHGLPAQELALITARPSPTLIAPRPEVHVDANPNPRWVNDITQSSLKGTEVDRFALQVDDNGELILTPGILVYFDYFLSLRGEMSLARIKQIVWDDITANYPEKIAAYLYGLFERYLAYSDAIDNHLKNLTRQQVMFNRISEQDIEQQFQASFFSPDEIESIFKGYHAMLDYPSEGKAVDEKMRLYRETPKEQQFAVATELFGAEAAGRLQALEQKRSEWQQRLTEYQQQKTAILQAGFDEAGELQALQELLDRSFSESEKLRVRTWEMPQ